MPSKKKDTQDDSVQTKVIGSTPNMVVVSAENGDPKLNSLGFAKRKINDKVNIEFATNIARGRAMKALSYKKIGKYERVLSNR